MASITALDARGRTVLRGSGARAVKYRARYRTPGGATRSKTFRRKIDAEQFLDTVGHRMVTGEFVDPVAGRMLFKEYCVIWLERKSVTTRPTTIETFTSHVRKHLGPAFGARELKSITRENVKQFAGTLQDRVAPTTARAVVFTLAAILREAVDDGRIAKNPAERIKVGSKTNRRVDPAHVAGVAGQVPQLAAAMPSRWRAAVLLMATTGLRLGECLGLTVDRVDFLRRTIRIDRQLGNLAGGSGFAEPKTDAGVRTIPVPSAVTDLLAAHLAEFGSGDDGLIFTTETGGPIGRSTWSKHYRAACAAVGIEGRTRTHDLRHVAASSLIASGLSVSAVQAALGHATPSETLDVYVHFWPTDEERTREAIGQASAAWLRTAT
ncbi:MAG: site-specific integrase [Actinomycetota bacterium]